MSKGLIRLGTKHEQQGIAEKELLLGYRIRNDAVKFATSAFLF